jgi:hypothetical protein
MCRRADVDLVLTDDGAVWPPHGRGNLAIEQSALTVDRKHVLATFERQMRGQSESSL